MLAHPVLLDIDGVLTVSWRALPGAVETIEWLRRNEVEFRLVTNTSSRSRGRIAELLEAAGMPVETDHIQTAVTAAAHYLGEHHAGESCFVVNQGDLDEDMAGVEVSGPDRAGVVLLGGAGPSTGYAELNHAFALALDGVPVVALHRNTRFQTEDGPALDMGAFIVGLEAAAGIEVTVVGKPAPAFFGAALADLGSPPEQVVMVGDDIGSDVLGAQAAGIIGVLVRTGKFRPADLDGDGLPDHVIDDIGHLPEILYSL